MSSTEPLVQPTAPPQFQPQFQPQPQSQSPQYAIPVQPQVPPYGAYQGMPAPPQPQPMMYAAAPVQYPQQHAHHVVMMNGGGGGEPQVPDYGGAFSDGIFDCFNDGASCLLSCCVAPIRWAMTVERARLMTLVYAVCAYGLAYWGSIALSSAYDRIMCTDQVHVCHGADWLPYMIWPLTLVCWIVMLTLGTVYRGKIRQQYNIHGDSLQDCCLHLWCTCCAIAQEARHVDRMTGHIPHVQYQRVI